MVEARIEPLVIVSPLEDERPVEATPWRVEEAVVEVAKKLLAEIEPANTPAPPTLKRAEGEEVEIAICPFPNTESIGEVLP